MKVSWKRSPKLSFSWGATQLWHSMVDRASVSNDWSSVLKEPFVTNLSEGRDGEMRVAEALVEEEPEAICHLVEGKISYGILHLIGLRIKIRSPYQTNWLRT